MKHIMTRQFSKWAKKQKIPKNGLVRALKALSSGNYEASLGGYLYKKRIRFQGKGKSGSGRSIIVYKKGDRAIFIHGFAKNEKANISKKELLLFKEFARILISLSDESIDIALKNGDFIEVKS